MKEPTMLPGRGVEEFIREDPSMTYLCPERLVPFTYRILKFPEKLAEPSGKVPAFHIPIKAVLWFTSPSLHTDVK
jgi:hypothetical protein